MTERKLAVRADAGSEIGYGHVVRSEALAQQFRLNGWKTTFLTTTPGSVKETVSEAASVVEIDDRNDVSETSRHLADRDVDVLFIDSYKADTAYQQEVSRTDTTVSVRQNFHEYTVCCDHLVYGNLAARTGSVDWVGEKPDICLGPEYLLLGDQFSRDRVEASNSDSDELHGLVLMGGSDPRGATPAVMRQLDRQGLPADIVVGPGFLNTGAIRSIAETSRTEFTLHHDPEYLPQLMRQADVAVTALGSTVFELMAVGTPFVGLVQADNQRPRAEEIRRRELAPVVNSPEAIERPLARFCEDDDIREQYRRRVDGLVDGHGPERVFDRIESLVGLDE